MGTPLFGAGQGVGMATTMVIYNLHKLGYDSLKNYGYPLVI